MARIGHLTAADLGVGKSAWEKLTQGQCNNELPEPKARKQTVRQLKDKAMRVKHLAAAERKFEKAAHLEGKALRKLSDSWVKRSSSNVTGFFDQKKAREVKRGAV